MGSRRPAVVAGAALLVAGVVAVASSQHDSDPVAHRVGANLPVNAGAGDPADLSANNSPRVEVNPQNRANLAIASRVDEPSFGCAVHVSFDGGGHWAQRPIPAPRDQTVSCFAPDLGFGPEGRLYVAFSSFADVPDMGNAPAAIWLVHSDDGGRTLSEPVKAAGPSPFNLRLAADPAHAGRLYLAAVSSSGTSSWGFSAAANPIVVRRSDDGGATWSEPVQVNPRSRPRVVAPVVAVAGGQIYVAYLDVGDDRLDYHGGHEGKGGDPYPGAWSLVVARSGDGGRTWRESVVDAVLAPVHRWLVLFPPAPSLAVDRASGRVYVAFHDARGTDSDVRVWASADDARTWSPPARLAENGSERRTQMLPALAVSRGGRVDLVYYDRRSDPGDVMNHVSLRSSFDHAGSFGPPVQLSTRAFDSRIGFGADRGMPDLGSRLGLVSTDDGALAVWADTRTAVEDTSKQDLARAVAAFSSSGSDRDALSLFGGLGLAAAGLVLMLLRPALGRSPRPAGAARAADADADAAAGAAGSAPAPEQSPGAEDDGHAGHREGHPPDGGDAVT